MADYVIGGLVATAFIYGMYHVYRNFTGKSSCCGSGGGSCGSCCACKPKK